jgi:hypothetical protein
MYYYITTLLNKQYIIIYECLCLYLFDIVILLHGYE